ncbi:MAG: (2Fe-2S)-binding protein [Sedimenticola sp.]
MKTGAKKNPLDKLPEILKQDMDRNLCVCNEVLKMDVINAIANGATTLEAVKQQTYATDGNGCCTRQVSRLIECIWDHEPAIQPTPDSSKRSK